LSRPALTAALTLNFGRWLRQQMHDAYFEVIGLIERLHRLFLEVIKGDLDRLGIHDINAVQALMLFNMGGAEMSVGELMLRGCYLGANVSYNVKKLVENGHLSQERSVHDRRRSRVRLTDKGAKLRDGLQSMHERHAQMLEGVALGGEGLQAAAATLRRLESFWSDARGISTADNTGSGADVVIVEGDVTYRVRV